MGRGKDKGPREKTCKCCKERFEPILNGQEKCIDCIMKHEPAKPTTDSTRTTEPEWVEWFIYHWRHIRIAAQRMRDGGIN